MTPFVAGITAIIAVMAIGCALWLLAAGLKWLAGKSPWRRR